MRGCGSADLGGRPGLSAFADLQLRNSIGLGPISPLSRLKKSMAPKQHLFNWKYSIMIPLPVKRMGKADG
jgi:hypothetical protein